MLEKFGLDSESTHRRDIIPDDPYRPNPDDGVGYVSSRSCFRKTCDDPLSRPSAPGTPPQSTPDYVLNPLSIYRMARKAIPEKHAPEKVVSPNTVTMPQPPRPMSQQPHQTMVIDRSLSDATPTVEHAVFDELQMFFTSDLGWAWQPAETALGSGIDDIGLLQCAPGFQSYGDGQDAPQLDFWTPDSGSR